MAARMTRAFVSRTGLAPFVGVQLLAGCEAGDEAARESRGESRFEADGDTDADSGAEGDTSADTAVPTYDGDCGSFLPAATEARTCQASSDPAFSPGTARRLRRQ